MHKITAGIFLMLPGNERTNADEKAAEVTPTINNDFLRIYSTYLLV